MNTLIIQARMGSTRLPGKILMPLAGTPMLGHIVERCRAAKNVDRVVVATTKDAQDDATAEFCRTNRIDYFRGDTEDVLARFFGAAEQFGGDAIIRVTADCPFVDPGTIDVMVERFETKKCDYIRNVFAGEGSFPRGLDVEVFSRVALAHAYKNATDVYDREHVTPYIWKNKKQEFHIGAAPAVPIEYQREHRLTVDYPEDFALVEYLYAKSVIETPQVFAYLDAHPQLAAINKERIQKPYEA